MNTTPIPGFNIEKYTIDIEHKKKVDRINDLLSHKGGITTDEKNTPILVIPSETPKIREFEVRDMIFDLLNDNGNDEFARLSKEQNSEIHEAIIGKLVGNFWSILSKESDINKRIQIIKLYFDILPKAEYFSREAFIIYGLENLNQYQNELKDLITYGLGKKKFIQNYLVGDINRPETLLIDDTGEIISAQTKISSRNIEGIYKYTMLTGKDKNRIYNGLDQKAYNFRGIKGKELFT